MRNNGFIRAKAVTIPIRLSDIPSNVEEIKKALKNAQNENVDIITFQELTLTGYTIGDLVFTQSILDGVKKAIHELKEFSKSISSLFAVGAPLQVDNSIFNTAIVFYNGHILGVSAKTYLPNYNEYYEGRHYSPSLKEVRNILLDGEEVPFGNKIIYQNDLMPEMKVGVEICEDMWATTTPSTLMCEGGATIILNLSASNERLGKAQYRHDLVKMTSARLMCAYVYASSGEGESTSDLVYSGHNLIAEDGHMLFENYPFENNACLGDIDLELLLHERNKNNHFVNKVDNMTFVHYKQDIKEKNTLHRRVDKNPFVPEDEDILERARFILKIQAHGLIQRMKATGSKKVVIGLSGGLDSTLALLVVNDAYDLLGYDKKDIHAITLPCFGTSERTKSNALELAKILGITLREIDISDSVKQHLKDIDHDLTTYDVAFENAQARERTQVLFDYSNMINALVIGTGDLSELALGWCTYNGDHMSSYNINVSIPKTLVIYLVKAYALIHNELKEVLEDIIMTPISPELLPLENGEIKQKTEDIIGPYQYHDFVLFHFLRYGYAPSKIYMLGKIAFKGIYQEDEMLKWMKIFFKRFFTSQFKRNCLPDGPKVGSVSISPRGDLRMPSDASYNLYLDDLK